MDSNHFNGFQFEHIRHSPCTRRYIAFYGMSPVSYTHLDVYKRQVFVLQILEKAANDPGVIKTHYQVSFGLALGTCIPVSYTHLDVYKRQTRKPATWSCLCRYSIHCRP